MSANQRNALLLPSEGKGRRFESFRVRQILTGQASGNRAILLVAHSVIANMIRESAPKAWFKPAEVIGGDV
jgi:hypothetical protein